MTICKCGYQFAVGIIKKETEAFDPAKRPDGERAIAIGKLLFVVCIISAVIAMAQSEQNAAISVLATAASIVSLGASFVMWGVGSIVNAIYYLPARDE
ncbi:hypothetical protein [Sphingobium baderi]|uniref:Uncharacterized protein n=1 Tax=Sphingobium baderi LL03 TaxID=1114964 RepID=T0I506_9SPHN|nr:hypothetical protein [Sphingobium baderi]EQB04719.1 hypothetical protein L485_03740 [Sphingobium baderi LL03]